jgi:outer membrane protein assembly factor BamB
MNLSRLSPAKNASGLLFVLCAGLLSSLGSAHAQASQSPEWTTDSFDAQRDGWQRNEMKISITNAKDIRLLWKIKTDNKTMGMQSFREPLIVAGVSTTSGTKTVAILAGSSNDVYMIDADTGSMVWQKKLKWSSSSPPELGEGSGFLCTNALTATPVVTPSGNVERLLYVLTSDGYIHTLTLSHGEEMESPVKMLPNPYGKGYGLNLVNGIVYTITGQSCGGVPNALYAYNTVNKKVSFSTPPQGGLWGVAGPAVSHDGIIYFESGDHPYDAEAGLLSTSV